MSGRPGLHTLLLGLLLASSSVHAESAPKPLQPGEKPLAGSTEAELWYGMDQAEKDLRHSPLLVQDAGLNAYVREVTCRVAGDYCPDLRVYILDVPVFNASMAPNGAMVVFTGALLRMRDESELALVIGHELGHYRLRHSLRLWEKAKRSSAWASAFAPFGLVGNVALLAGYASTQGFSRGMEIEADRWGFGQLLDRGYDPGAGIRLWQRLQAEEQSSHERKPLAIFASHPRTQERLDDMRELASGLPAPAARTRNGLADAIRPLLPGWMAAELSRRRYDSSVLLMQGLLDSADAGTRGLAQYHLAEAYRRRNAGDDRQRAHALYAQAVLEANPPASAWREHGLALRAQGRRAEAAQALLRYLSLAPDAEDRAFIAQYLAELESTE